MRLIQLSDGAKSYVIDCYRFGPPEALPKSLAPLRQLFENDYQKKVVHNYKFEYRWLTRKLGMELKSHFDTFLGSKLVDYKSSAGLGDVADRYLGIPVNKDEQLSDWSRPKLSESQLEYAARDPFHLPELRELIFKDLKRTGQLETAGIEFNCTGTIAETELAGFPIDTELWKEMCVHIEEDRDRKAKILKDTIAQALGIEFEPPVFQTSFLDEVPEKTIEMGQQVNLRSQKQMLEAFREMGVPLENTNKNHLETLLPRFPQLQVLVNYRKAEKLVGSYGQNILELINPKTGRLHASFWQLGTQCTGFNTLIPTEKGMQRIGEIKSDLPDNKQIKFETRVLNRNCNLEKTSHFVKFTDRETICLETSLGIELEATPHHPILGNRFSPAEYLNNHDGARYHKRFFSPESEQWKKLEDLQIGDYVKVPIGYKAFPNEYQKFNLTPFRIRTNAKQIKLPQILDEDLAEFAGIYFSDGSIHDANGTYSIRISNSNADVISRVKFLAGKLFDLEVNSIPDETTITTYLTSKSLGLLETKLDLRRRCENKVIPNCILQSPESVVKAFVKGMTLDACVITEGAKLYLKINVCNKQSAQDLQAVLFSFGIVSAVRKVSGENKSWTVSIYNEDYFKFAEAIGFVQSGKYQEPRALSNRRKYLMAPDGKSIWVKVKKTSRSRADVFDFTLPQTHSFISNGLISHNTGRLSCSNPNIQQIPKEEHYRKACRPTRPGRKFVLADYSQLELRILAHKSNDRVMIEAFEKDIDLHTLTASGISGLPMSEIHGKHPARDLAKILNFGIAYGLGAPGVSAKTGKSIEEAEEMLRNFAKTYPGMDRYLQQVVQEGLRNGFVRTLSGRMCRLEFDKNDRKSVGNASRNAKNFPIQGSTGDILKVALPDLARRLKLRCPSAWIVNYVHDEVILECDEGEAEEAKVQLESALAFGFYSFVDKAPCKADAKIADSWFEK